MHVSVFLATYFETNGHFDSNVKLFPVIYANYRPMTDDRRQTETLGLTKLVNSDKNRQEPNIFSLWHK